MAKKEIRKSKRIASRPVSSLAAHAEQAVKDYEQALGLLHRRDYAGAAEAFEKVIKTYPEEKEMADRCRAYLRACEREQSDKVLPLKRAEDYYYQAIVESNRQRYDEALGHRPAHVLSDAGLGEALAVTGEAAESVRCIARAQTAATALGMDAWCARWRQSAAPAQPDGKVLIAGKLQTVNCSPYNVIARLNADGTTDHTFITALSGFGPFATRLIT